MAKLDNSSTAQLVGFVVDMFCSTMMDVAEEFGVPCYAFCTSSAASLAMSFDVQELYNRDSSSDKAAEQLVERLHKYSNVELVVPSFVNPIPSKVVPRSFSNYEIAVWFFKNFERLRSNIKGILVNTFVEMEPHVMNWSSRTGVGPILQLKNIGTLDRVDGVLK